MKLYIKNKTFLKKINKNLNIYDNKNLISFSKYRNIKEEGKKEKEIITKEIEGFTINIYEKELLVTISYKEKRPYYLTESLYDKLEALMNNIKIIKKLKINKNVLLNKSYIGIEWNIINRTSIFSSSFISYYLFNGNLLGILSNLKEKENDFWLNNIEEFNNNRTIINYNYLVKENNCKVYDFINNNN